jgi:hypothetical protein
VIRRLTDGGERILWYEALRPSLGLTDEQGSGAEEMSELVRMLGRRGGKKVDLLGKTSAPQTWQRH